MKPVVFMAAVLLMSMTTSVGVAEEKGGEWRSLTDGKTLDGWHAVGDGKWTMENGVIIGRANSEKLYGLLVSDETFRNFSVRYRFKCVIGNSGFYVRTYILPPEKAHGLQVQVGKTKTGTGGIYESYKRGWIQRPSNKDQLKYVKNDDWNDMRIDVNGQSIIVHVNGFETADLKNEASRPVGHFALQMHSANVMDIRFKDI